MEVNSRGQKWLCMYLKLVQSTHAEFWCTLGNGIELTLKYSHLKIFMREDLANLSTLMCKKIIKSVCNAQRIRLSNPQYVCTFLDLALPTKT